MDSKQDKKVICKNCKRQFDTDSKEHLFLPLGFIHPKTKAFIVTQDWCLNCCISVEKGEFKELELQANNN